MIHSGEGHQEDFPKQESFEIPSSPARSSSRETAVAAQLWSTGTEFVLGSAADESKQLHGVLAADIAAPLFAACATILPGAEYSLTLRTKGTAQLVAASNERIRALDGYQLEVGEGPIIEVLELGSEIVNCHLNSSADRWPRYTPLSVSAGYEMVHAFPLSDVGVLAGSGRGNRNIGRRLAEEISAVTSLGSVAIRSGARLNAARELAGQLQQALDSRVIIEQAKGMVSAWLGLRADDAFDAMRQLARTQQLRLVDLAAALVSREVDEQRFRAMLQAQHLRRSRNAHKGSRTG